MRVCSKSGNPGLRKIDHEVTVKKIVTCCVVLHSLPMA